MQITRYRRYRTSMARARRVKINALMTVFEFFDNKHCPPKKYSLMLLIALYTSFFFF